MLNPDVKDQTLEERVRELEWELEKAQKEAEGFAEEVESLKDELAEWDDYSCPDCASLESELEKYESVDFDRIVQDIRIEIARGHHAEAIDLCDRFLPVSMRYAT